MRPLGSRAQTAGRSSHPAVEDAAVVISRVTKRRAAFTRGGGIDAAVAFGIAIRRVESGNGFMHSGEQLKIVWAYIIGIYFPQVMAKTKIAKLFRNGRSQAVRLPKEFRFEGDIVRVRQVDGGVLLEPVTSDVRKWFAEMDRLNTEPFFAGGRNQPKPPRRKFFP